LVSGLGVIDAGSYSRFLVASQRWKRDFSEFRGLGKALLIEGFSFAAIAICGKTRL